MSDNILVLSHLTKRFGAVQAVQDLSLEVRAGEIFGFLGPNGAGKTTTISLICGLVRPDAGTVVLNGAGARSGAHSGGKRGHVSCNYEFDI